MLELKKLHGAKVALILMHIRREEFYEFIRKEKTLIRERQGWLQKFTDIGSHAATTDIINCQRIWAMKGKNSNVAKVLEISDFLLKVRTEKNWNVEEAVNS